MAPGFKFFASDDSKVGHLLAAVDAAASRCTAAAQHLAATATKERELKGKGDVLEADAARATKLAAQKLAIAAEEVAVAKKTLALVSHAIAEAAVADASAATRALVDLLGQEGSDHEAVAAATRAAARAVLAVGGKQGLASAARAEAVAAASFAKAASSFAASPTDFYIFSWDGVEPSTTTGSTSSDQQAGPREKAESSNKFRVDHWKSLSSDFRVGGGGGPRIRLIATAARLLNREMMKHGQVVTIDKIEELLLAPIDAGSPQLRALLPHLVTIAHKLPLPDEVRPDLGLPAQPPAIPKVLLPSDFYAAPPPAAPVVHQIIQVQPPAESTQKLNWASFVYGAVVSYAVTLGMDKALKQMKEYRPDFTKLGHPSMDETPEPQCFD